MDRTPNQSNHQTHKKSANPTTKKDDVRITMALSDEKSRLRSAREEGVITVAKKLLDSGMPLNEVAEYTPYDVEKLQQLIKNYRE